MAKWYFGDANSKFRPFVGAGVSYVWYDSIQLNDGFQRALSSKYTGGAVTTASSSANLSSSWAPVLNAGATYNFDKNWSVSLSVSYVSIKTNADITTNLPAAAGGTTHSSTSLTINPIVSFLSVGYKF